MLSWANDVFIDCYRTIQYQSQDVSDPKLLGLLKSIQQDLSQVLVTPGREELSKQKLIDNKAPIEFSNGDLFKLNEQFIEGTILLANELDLNELAAAEVFFHSNDCQLDSNYISGVNFIDRGRQAFFKRYEYILNILGFLITQRKLELVVTDFNKFGDNLIQSFAKIYKIIDNLNDLITKQFVTNNVNDTFIKSIRYSKTELYNCHELLGQVLYNLVDNYFEKYGNATFYSKILSHLNASVDDNELMLIHYFPAVLNVVSNIMKLPEVEITKLHSQMTANLNNDYKLVSLNNDVIDLTNSKLKNFEILLIFIFLTNLIQWCKEGDNFQKFNFDDDILNYIQMCLNYGVLENLLRFTNETANEKTIKDFELNNLCDFRGLLQSNFPNLSFIKMSTASLNTSGQLNNSFNSAEIQSQLTPALKISTVFKDDLLPYYWHIFFMNFISHVAIVLTQLRDSEEDYLLSSINKHHRSIKDRTSNTHSDNSLSDQNLLLKGGFNDPKPSDSTGLITTSTELTNNMKSLSSADDELQLNFNEIYLRADLERFYLSFVYTYNERSNLCALVWNDDLTKNELLGFINWGVNNNSSPLITATFCLLLSSLTCRENVASTTKIWEILINNNSSFKKTDYSKISMDSIIDSLHYYLNSLNENYENDLNDHFNQKQKRHDFLFSQNSNTQKTANNIVIELSEDSTIFISGFVLLISSIVDKLNDGSERSIEIRQNLFNRFKPVIHGFLKFDNLMINSQIASSKSSDTPAVLINDSNRSVLINLMFHLLKCFNDLSNYNLRYEIWEIVDKWLYHAFLLEEIKPNSESTNSAGFRSTGINSAPGAMNVQSSNTTDKIRQQIYVVNLKAAFKINLVNLPNVSNFVELVKDLLTPPTKDQLAYSTILPEEEDILSLKLLYPANLGYGYRVNNQIGIWPYVEYLIMEVLSNSNKLKEESLKISLQDDIVSLILSSLEEIDWEFITATLPYISTNGNFNVGKYFTDGLNLNLFIKLHHSVAILNYLYDEKAYKAVFDIISNEQDESLVVNSLKTLKEMIKLQDVFNDTFSVNLKEENQGKINQLGTNPPNSSGLSRPPTGFNLLLSSTRTNSSTSLISSSTLNMINNLTIYYPGYFNVIKFADVLSYNASIIVKLGLLVNSSNIDTVQICLSLLSEVNQKFFESKYDDNLLIKNKLLTLFLNSNESGELKYGFINQFINGDIDLKFGILKFLIDDLNKSNGEPSLTHFILGYDIKGNHLILPEGETQGFIHQLIYYLMTCFKSISVIDYNNGVNIIEYNAVMLSSLILQVLYKLCSIPITSDITLQLLRDFTIEEDNLFEQLIKHHVKVDLDTVWDRAKFEEELLTTSNKFLNDNMSILAFFEFFKMRDLIIKYLTVEFHSLTQLGSIYKKSQYLEYLINGGKFLNESHRILNFLDILNFKFSDVELFNYQKFQHLNLNLLYSGMQSKSFKDDIAVSTDYTKGEQMVSDKVFTKLKRVNDFKQDELKEVKGYLTNFIIKENLNNLQSGYLHSWVQLIEVIINDGNLSKDKNQNFILEVLSSILPKINEFFDKNNKFSEELISLCVVMFDYYEDDNIFIERLLTLFSTCYKGIVSGNSSIELRNDLYIIMNNFLQKSFKQDNEKLLHKIIEILNKIDLNFLAIICNDSIINEGSIRITSIILLESIIHLFNKFNNAFIIDKLIKNNWLLLMIRSVKRIDEIFDDQIKDISVILYELINFKSVINLLIRVGQIRTGSAYLIQSELFSILKQSKFLNIDPDLGINLKLNEISKVNLSINSNLTFVNYFEFLIPVFKLISILLLSMGPNYKPSKIQGKNLMQHFSKLRSSIIKKDILINNNKIEYQYEKELTELMNQFVLIDSLIED